MEEIWIVSGVLETAKSDFIIRLDSKGAFLMPEDSVGLGERCLHPKYVHAVDPWHILHLH